MQFIVTRRSTQDPTVQPCFATSPVICEKKLDPSKKCLAWSVDLKELKDLASFVETNGDTLIQQSLFVEIPFELQIKDF